MTLLLYWSSACIPIYIILVVVPCRIVFTTNSPHDCWRCCHDFTYFTCTLFLVVLLFLYAVSTLTCFINVLYRLIVNGCVLSPMFENKEDTIQYNTTVMRNDTESLGVIKSNINKLYNLWLSSITFRLRLMVAHWNFCSLTPQLLPVVDPTKIPMWNLSWVATLSSVTFL